jgi:hypothetical protein
MGLVWLHTALNIQSGYYPSIVDTSVSKSVYYIRNNNIIIMGFGKTYSTREKKQHGKRMLKGT